MSIYLSIFIYPSVYPYDCLPFYPPSPILVYLYTSLPISIIRGREPNGWKEQPVDSVAPFTLPPLPRRVVGGPPSRHLLPWRRGHRSRWRGWVEFLVRAAARPNRCAAEHLCRLPQHLCQPRPRYAEPCCLVGDALFVLGETEKKKIYIYMCIYSAEQDKVGNINQTRQLT